MNCRFLIICVAILFAAVCSGEAAENRVETLLPSKCGPAWTEEGPVSTYTRENLYKYIDGEAELYLPYGFDGAAAALYIRRGNREAGLVVNIFRMGSTLDAFGIYANYRAPSLERAPAGADGFVEESQIMFFQDKYFVQVMSSGASTPDKSDLTACAASVAANLPGPPSLPRELDLVAPPGLVAGTEKYFPENLLGYRFLGKGLTSEVMLGGGRAKAFVVLGNSKQESARVFDDYVAYLTESKARLRVSGTQPGRRLHAVDPLFKGMALREVGPYAIGLAGLRQPEDGDETIDRWAGTFKGATRSLP
jgi:hypothetical protein